MLSAQRLYVNAPNSTPPATPRSLSRLLLACIAFLLGSSSLDLTLAAPSPTRPPNIVLIFADDLGWSDLSCYGAPKIRTPHLDRLAREGTRFTSFYVSQPVCSASRASLLTGCYANRIGIHGALGPRSKTGINANELTLAELLHNRGYRTAIFGKWHLGDAPQFLPTAHGFDEYFGLPYSNDMWPLHPTAKPGTYPPLPLFDGTNVVQTMPDQRQLTRLYTDRAVQFIERNQSHPFFLYLPHNMPHVPLHVSDDFKGHSKQGLYGDVIEEIDHSVGRVLQTLNRLRLAQNTWVIFLSDNGPWHNYGNHAGSAGGLREGKGSVFEGGVRVPCIMRWPGHIPSKTVSKSPLMSIDLLPTIAGRVGGALPQHPIDGRDVWPLLSHQPHAQNPHPAYAFYYNQNELQGLRSGPWKLLLPHKANGLAGNPPGRDGKPGPYQKISVDTELYNLDTDPAERRNVALQHPEVLRELESYAEQFRADLGDSLTKRTGSGVRPPGRLPDSPAP